jgi:hypothetical protein
MAEQESELMKLILSKPIKCNTGVSFRYSANRFPQPPLPALAKALAPQDKTSILPQQDCQPDKDFPRPLCTTGTCHGGRSSSSRMMAICAPRLLQAAHGSSFQYSPSQSRGGQEHSISSL